MATARLSTKGQLVIPQDIRERNGWRAGDTFEVVERDGVVILRPAIPRPPRTTLDQVAGRLAGDAPPMSVADMQAAIVAEARRRWEER